MSFEINRQIIEVIEVPKFSKPDDGLVFFESKLAIMLVRINKYLLKTRTYGAYELVNFRIDKNTHKLLVDSDFLIDIKIKLYNMNTKFNKLLDKKPHLMNTTNKKYVKFVNKINDLNQLLQWFEIHVREFALYCINMLVENSRDSLMLDNYTLALMHDNYQSILANKIALKLA